MNNVVIPGIGEIPQNVAISQYGYKPPLSASASAGIQAPISNSNLGSGTINYPPAPVNNTSAQDNLGITANSFIEGLNAPKDNSADSIFGSILQQQAGKSQFIADQQTAQGLEAKQNALNAINARALSTARAYENQIRATREAGGIQAGVNLKVQDLARKRDEHLADIAIEQAVAQGDVQTAQGIIDSKVKAKFEPLDNILQTLSAYRQYKNADLTQKEQLQLQNNYSNLKSKTDNLQKEASDLYTNITQNGGTAVLPKVNQAVQDEIVKLQKDPNYTPDLSKIYAAAGSYGIDTLKELQLKKAQADLNKTLSDDQVLSIKDAKDLGVPYGTTKGEAKAMGKVPGVSQDAQVLKTNALTAAQELKDRLDRGLVQTGFRSAFGTIPGTSFRDSKVLFNNLKSLLSLDNVKYLKGQGQVSDAERRLLEQASSKLDLSLSGDQFSKALNDVITSLSGKTSTYSPGTILESNGKKYKVEADGETVTPL